MKLAIVVNGRWRGQSAIERRHHVHCTIVVIVAVVKVVVEGECSVLGWLHLHNNSRVEVDVFGKSFVVLTEG